MIIIKFGIKCSICDKTIAETDNENISPAKLAENAGAWDMTLTQLTKDKNTEGGYVCKECHYSVFAATEKPILKSGKCATGYHLHSRKIIKPDTKYIIIEVSESQIRPSSHK